MKRDIVIYNDDGVGEFGLYALQKFFAGDDVWLCNADAVIEGSVLGLADIFVMPGGADLPYCKKLSGEGNENIRAFVESGGTYLGVCAGAYYACEAIEYHKGRSDEICEARELAFIPGVAVGSLSVLAEPYDGTLKSAAIIKLALEGHNQQQAFYQGGCTFTRTDALDTEIIASYAQIEGAPPAIIRSKVGEGTVVLSGVHFEIGADELFTHPATDDKERARAHALAKGFHPFSKKNWNRILFGQKETAA